MRCPRCNAELRLVVAGGGEASAAGGSEIGELLAAIQDADLDPRAAVFVSETRERYNKYGDGIRMSPKQTAWLKKIAKGENKSLF